MHFFLLETEYFGIFWWYGSPGNTYPKFLPPKFTPPPTTAGEEGDWESMHIIFLMSTGNTSLENSIYPQDMK